MSNISSAQQYLGSQKFDDLCQAFVEQATYGHQGVYPSAIAAWNSQNNRVRGMQGIQPGDLVYFDADSSNNGFGHAGIYMGNNQFISATNNGVQQRDLDQWQKATGQQLLGYVPQGQSAQGLGAQLNTNTQKMMGKPPTPQPTYDFNEEMANFRNIWNMTHATPLASYI